MASTITINQALAQACQRLDATDARVLLQHTLGVDRAYLVTHEREALTATRALRFDALVARRAAGEPIAYLTGTREFYGLSFRVTPDVLIPRPETELVVDIALTKLAMLAQPALLDLGTGSGAVALALKRHLASARVVAVERSAAALAVARRNALKLGLEVDLRHGLWFAPVAGERFDLVVSNPPYVAVGDPHLAQGDLRFEPQSALVAGADGLQALREIAASAAEHLNPGGWLLLEHGVGQDDEVRKLLREQGLEGIESWPDLAGIARVTGGGLKS